MNPIGPRPYMAQGQGIKKEEESEQKTQDSLQQNNGGGRQGQQQQQQNQQQNRTIASGKASDIAKKQPPRRRHIEPRPVPRHVQEEQERQKQVAQNRQAATNPQQNVVHQPQPQPVAQPMPPRPVQQPVQQLPMQNVQQPMDKPAVQEPLQPQVYEAEGIAPADSRPAAATSNKINIAQILKDFRNTMSAIATPDILREEVEDYLKEIEANTKGEAPSINLVQTDLMNAAAIVDRYISETLNKESKVVSKWLDALFLQRINYRYNDGEVNKAFLVKFPESEEEKRAKAEKAQKEAQQVQQPAPQAVSEPIPAAPQNYQTQYEPIEAPVEQPRQVIQQSNHVTSPIKDYVPQREIVAPQPQRAKKKPEVTIIPQDNELKSLFIQAKKHAFAHNPSKAMDMFHRALVRAQQIKDGEAESKICLEMGKIYDENNYVVQALSSYNKSLKSTTDNSLKTQAHYSMAQIYDDVNQVEPALSHYLTSVSYAGENDNLVAQSTSLTKIANIFSNKYDTQAFDFYEQANLLVAQTNDSKTKGFVKSNTAGAYTQFDRPDKAMRFYADAVKNYSDASSQENIAENYKAAAELMLNFRNPAKARVLLKKALNHADRSKDVQLIDEINDLLEEIA
mgnify:CR=1 FL=1